MPEVTGMVVELSNDCIVVETESRSSCSHCDSTACTSSVISAFFGARKNRLQLVNHLGAERGQRVIIGIADNAVVSASLWAYLLPIAVMLLMVVSAQMAGATDLLQAAMGAIGLFGGLQLLRLIARYSNSWQHLNPRLLRYADQASVSQQFVQIQGVKL